MQPDVYEPCPTCNTEGCDDCDRLGVVPHECRVSVVRVPMLDTGIGREAGFRDDAHLIEVAKAEREAMDPLTRAVAEEVDRRVDEAFLFGTGDA